MLAEQLMDGSYECMVCCDRVKQVHAIWSCDVCNHILHMGCIKKWARSPAAKIEGVEGEHFIINESILCRCPHLRQFMPLPPFDLIGCLVFNNYTDKRILVQ